METSLENKHLGNGGYFRNYCFFLASFIVDRARCKWTGRSAVEQNIENERFTVVCSRCRLNLKFGNFTLSFGRLRQRIVLKCVPHVQHDYFSSFNQLDHCFLASSLSLPSTLLKLPIEIPAATSGHLQLHTLITCNNRQHFAGNCELFLV